MNILERLFVKKEEACCNVRIEEVKAEENHAEEVIGGEKDGRAIEK